MDVFHYSRSEFIDRNFEKNGNFIRLIIWFLLQCPFGRLVAVFDYKNMEFLLTLQSFVTDINARALGLDNMPAHVVQLALSTYKLSK